jgi:hypothetical protein
MPIEVRADLRTINRDDYHDIGKRHAEHHLLSWS